MAATDSAHAPRVRPDLAFLRAHPAHLIALGFGAGLMRPGPGTWGTAAAWVLYAGLAVVLDLSLPAQTLIGLVALVSGTWAAGRAGAALGEEDAREIVVDEMVAFWWVLLLLPRGGQPWLLQTVAFLLFRVFDIFKPVPIAWMERRWRNALGVMLDDLMAGAYTVLVITLWLLLER